MAHLLDSHQVGQQGESKVVEQVHAVDGGHRFPLQQGQVHHMVEEGEIAWGGEDGGDPPRFRLQLLLQCCSDSCW